VFGYIWTEGTAVQPRPPGDRGIHTTQRAAHGAGCSDDSRFTPWNFVSFPDNYSSFGHYANF
jgi:hypothetical protein